jgi:hypothetical protein
VYCGTFKAGPESGNWNVACGASGDCSGSYFATTSSSSGTLTGKLTGTSISLTDEKGKTSTGTVSGTTVTGQCSADGACGFTGSVEACSK